MGSLPEVDDLRLVAAVARLGSVGAAAREMLISQPSASQRLGALERRVGERLFVRDPSGARPTPAGREMAARAEHILLHLSSLVEQTRAAARARPLSVGTFASLAALLFPAVEAELAVEVAQIADHGDRLIEWVAEGSLDLAVVAIADQLVLPAGVVATPLGRDDYAMLLPSGVDGPGRGRQPYRGRRLVAYAIDFSHDLLVARLAALGAEPRTAGTAEAAVRIARARRLPVVMPRCLLRMYATPDERVVKAPVRRVVRLTAVTLGPPPDLAGLGRRLGLREP
jgi:DNA-binding transcriptional LysR family regulator